MMGNIFISALIAIFFLGKSSKEKHEKTRNASGFRIIIYFSLTIICGVLFYKSYQISTIQNYIDLSALRGEEDSLCNSKDTVINLSIYNHFDTFGSYNNGYLDCSRHESGKDSLFNQYSGVHATIKVCNTSNDTKINRTRLDERAMRNLDIENNISNIGQIYMLNFISTNIPRFIPLYPIMDSISGPIREESALTTYYSAELNTRGNFDLFFNDSISYFKDKKIQQSLNNGIVSQKICLLDNIKDSLYFIKNYYGIYTVQKFANTIDFLIAADLSQYTYVLFVNSDMPIKELYVDYNIPIEINNIPEGLDKATYGFDLNDEMCKELNRGLVLHIKLPTMENLQLIRSLILTALLTTFFSLLCSNVYFWFRRCSLRHHRKHKLNVSILKRIDRSRVNLFRNFHRGLLMLLIIFIGYVAGMVFFDKTQLISFDFNWYEIVGSSLLIIVILCIVIYYLYKYAITPLPKKRGKDKIREASKAGK